MSKRIKDFTAKYNTVLQRMYFIMSHQSSGNVTEGELPYKLEKITWHKNAEPPNLIIVSGISGSGKTTSLKHVAELGYKKLRTVTTRCQRLGETEDDAIFVKQEEFDLLVKQNKLFYPHVRNKVSQGILIADLQKLKDNKVRTYADRSVASTRRLIKELPSISMTLYYMLPPTLKILYQRISEREKANREKSKYCLLDDDILDRFDEEIEDMKLLSDLPYVYIVNDTQKRIKKLLQNSIILND